MRLTLKHGLRLLGAAFRVLSTPVISRGGGEVLDLGGTQWSVRNSNGSITAPATVPGLVYTDLYAAGIIDDPYYSNNFNYTRWVSDDSWTYTRKLSSLSPKGKKWSDYRKVYLVFDGLDTAAHIKINSHNVGFANNQFRQWTFEVTQYVSDEITLQLEFESAIKYALTVFESTGSPYTVFTNYNWEYPEGREYIRKMQSDFGWDWGPHFAPQGIYRDAYLVGLDDGIFVTNTFVDIYKAGQRPNIPPDQDLPWVVNVSLDYLAATSTTQVILSTKVAGSEHKNTTRVSLPGMNQAGILFNLSDSSVERWWPHELGTPKLYDMIITLENSGEGMKPGPTAQVSKSVGFRTIVLNLKEYTDRFGANFHFEVNGQPFNVKGSNIVPVDAFESRVDDAWYRRIFQSAIASNFNMIRVWASGNYYRDSFYEMADELGIFLWSEFQFSDNYYPVFPEFLDNVVQEVRYQIRRLNRHPSMAVWTGGNEMEGYSLLMLAYNNTYGQSFFDNYTQLAEKTIWPELYSNSRSLSWIQGSDSHGYSFYNPDTGAWVNRWGDPGTDFPNPYYGAGENYNTVTDQAFNRSKLVAARFMVEFGVWSYDSLESYQTILPDHEIRPKNSIIMQRCYENAPVTVVALEDAVRSYYIYPNRTDELVQFDQFSWTTQIYQSEHIKNQIESYRRSISLPEHNMGQLFWQLNAPWTTLTFNSIEYTERWKVLQYTAKQLFERVTVSSWIDPGNSTYNLWVTSDYWGPVDGTVTATWTTWSGDVLDVKTYPFHLSGLDSKEIDQKQGWVSILPHRGTIHNSVLLFNLTAQSKDGKTFDGENFLVPNFLSNSTLVDPGLELQKVDNQTWRVSATRGTAAYVWLSHPIGVKGYFDNNAVFMAKGSSRSFTFTVLEDTTHGAWLNEVRVRSMWDNLEFQHGAALE